METTQNNGADYNLRIVDQINAFLDGLEVVRPGVVPKPRWPLFLVPMHQVGFRREGCQLPAGTLGASKTSSAPLFWPFVSHHDRNFREIGELAQHVVSPASI